MLTTTTKRLQSMHLDKSSKAINLADIARFHMHYVLKSMILTKLGAEQGCAPRSGLSNYASTKHYTVGH